MKLIIDIPEEEYKDLMQTSENTINLGELLDLRNSVRNGTPLDDVKAEIDYERNLYLNLVGNSGYCNGLNKALKIIDNIGKAESEDK